MSAAPPRPTLRYRTALAIALGSAVCVMVLTVLVGGGRGVIRPPADSLVYTVEGQGTAEVKDEFEVRDGWELHGKRAAKSMNSAGRATAANPGRRRDSPRSRSRTPAA